MKVRVAIVICVFLAPPVLCAELADRRVEVYGQRIHYAETGSGPTLILLHGLWGGLNEWQPIIDELSRAHRVLVMDFLGFHGSDKPNVDYHNALLAQFLAGFIEALDLDDVTLVGHAMGANTSTYTAVHHPAGIKALVLVDGAGYVNPDRDLSAPVSAPMLRFRRIATGSTLATTRGLLERRVADPALVTDQWVEEAYSLWVDSARAIADMLREGGDLTSEEMRTIAVPTLVIWGAEDRVFSPDNAARLDSDIENASVHLVADAGHLPQLERTDEFLKILLPFLDRVYAPPQ